MFIGKDEDIDVFDGNNFRSSIYFSNEMKSALGLVSGFPLDLNLNPKPDLSVPVIQFYTKTHPLSDAFVKQKYMSLQINSSTVTFVIYLPIHR